ncbi:MAG: hypothetical protein WKF96_03335 [Solirubrobacteraceae bacterium]
MRVIVATLWSGPIVVRRLAAADAAPSLAELDQIATAMVARNDGIRPVVRVLERSGIGGGLGAPGSVPRG